MHVFFPFLLPHLNQLLNLLRRKILHVNLQWFIRAGFLAKKQKRCFFLAKALRHREFKYLLFFLFFAASRLCEELISRQDAKALRV